MKQKLSRGVLGTIIALSMMVGMIGCGSSSYDTNYAAKTTEMAEYDSYSDSMGAAANDEAYYDEAWDDSYAQTTSDVNVDESAAQSNSSRKLIRTVNLDVETLHFEQVMEALQEQTTALGGYIESMDLYNGSSSSYYRNTRSASLTIRIPKNKLDGFLNTISEISNVISRGENVEDVTLTYSDLESHKAVLQAEHARLMEFLEQAETIEDMLTIESRLSDIQYQLESMESQLRTYDNKVDYSTLYLQVNEVEELTPVEEEPELTTWQRISKGFMNNLNGILNGLKEIGIWFLIHIPTFVLLGVITLIIIQFILKITKKSKKKELAVYTQQQNMTAPQQQNMTAPQQEKKNNGK